MFSFDQLYLCLGVSTASHLEKISSVVFNITKGGIETIMRPLTALSKTADTFGGSLKSSNGKTAVNILGNTGTIILFYYINFQIQTIIHFSVILLKGGRLPYNVFGSAEGGGTLEFFGRIVSSIRPYLVPLRIVKSKSSGNASSLVWTTSEEQRKK